MELKMIKDMFITGKEKETLISKNDIYKEILHSDLNLIFKDEIFDMCDTEILKVVSVYNLRMERIRQKVMQDIDMILSSSNITPVFFKGSILASLLYGKENMKRAGDIDLYVEPQSFVNTEKLLIANGFEKIKGENIDLHTSFKYGNQLIELHKDFIGKRIGVNTIFETHTTTVDVNGYQFTTLDTTYHLLYLMYHIYMHRTDDIARRFSHALFEKQEIYQLDGYDRNLFEIALYIAKFKHEVDWTTIITELDNQSLNVSFKQLYERFINIYPEIFPDCFNCYFKSRDYICPKEFQLYNYVIDHYPSLSLNECIRNSIDAQREDTLELECGNEPNASMFSIDECSSRKINPNQTYILDGNKPKSADDISYKLNFFHDDEYLYINVFVTDDVLQFCPHSTYDTMAADYVYITIVHTHESYCYRNITLYPYIDGNTNGLDIYNICLFENINEKLNAQLYIKENGYDIALKIPLNYLGIKSTDDYFYMDILVNDCDDVKIGRNTALSFSSVWDRRYDPRTYALIRMK